MLFRKEKTLQRLFTSLMLTTNPSKKMTTINWLNDNGVLISKDLADSLAAFEYKYDISVNNQWVSGLIQELGLLF